MSITSKISSCRPRIGKDNAISNVKKRKTKCFSINLDATLVKPESKKKNAEKQSLISKESKALISEDDRTLVHDSIKKTHDKQHSKPKKNDEYKPSESQVSLYKNKVDVILQPMLWTTFYENMIKMYEESSVNYKRIHPMISRSKLRIIYNDYLKVMSETEINRYRMMLKSSKTDDPITSVYDFHKKLTYVKPLEITKKREIIRKKKKVGGSIYGH